MYRIARNGTGQDFAIATGVAHSIAEFAAAAFAAVRIDDWRTYVQTDESLLRPAERANSVGDPSKASRIGWKPSMPFDQLVAAMVHSDLEEQQHT